MTKEQDGYDKMSLSSESFLSDNTAITDSLPMCNDYLTVIKTTHAQIEIVKVQQEAEKGKQNTIKTGYRSDSTEQTMDVVRKLTAYATNTNNTTLLALIDYTESDLNKSPDSKFTNICQLVHDNANTYLSDLSSYMVTAEQLATMQTSITNFKGSVTKGRVDESGSEQTTQQLKTLFETLKAYWDKIDKLIEIVHTTQPDFYNKYQIVRKIVKTTKSSVMLKIQANDAQTGLGLANVTLTIVSTVTSQSIIKRTSDGGGSQVKDIDEGKYTITAVKPGFKTVSTNANVVSGELASVTINMEKEP
jgi:hypothetical protein